MASEFEYDEYDECIHKDCYSHSLYCSEHCAPRTKQALSEMMAVVKDIFKLSPAQFAEVKLETLPLIKQLEKLRGDLDKL